MMSSGGASSAQAQVNREDHSTDSSSSIFTPSSSQESHSETARKSDLNCVPGGVSEVHFDPGTGRHYYKATTPTPSLDTNTTGPHPYTPNSGLNTMPPIHLDPTKDRRFTGAPRVPPSMTQGILEGAGFHPQAPKEMRQTGFVNKAPGGGPVNWQPWRQTIAPDDDDELELDACSNVAVACEGDRNQQGVAAIGPRMMDFRNEYERGAYIDGWGLPVEGNTIEARLMRVINMNHYVLVGHIDKAQKEMKQYVCATVNKVVDHSQNVLGRKMQLVQNKIDALPKGPVDETRAPQSSFVSPSGEPQARTRPHEVSETDDHHSFKHMELAVLKLIREVEKIKAENQLRKAEKAERKELEEILADELLYHNRAMGVLQAKVKSIDEEVASLWKEIRKLQGAAKGSETVASRCKLPAVKLAPAMLGDIEIPQIPTTTTPDPDLLLRKINEELDNLDVKNGGKRSSVIRDDEECTCELCAKARAGKSAGVTVEEYHDDPKIRGVDREKGKRKEMVLESLITNPVKLKEHKLTVGERLAALNLTAIDHAIVTNVTPSSPILQKWREVYRRSLRNNQSVLELMRPNGDVVILLVEPNEGRQKGSLGGYGLKDDEPPSPVSTSSTDPTDITSLEIICPPGPYPSTLEEAFAAMEHLLYSSLEHPSAKNAPAVTSTKIQPVQGQATTPKVSKLPSTVPVKQVKVNPFAPLPQVAKSSVSATERRELPTFGKYGFPWVAPDRQPMSKLGMQDQTGQKCKANTVQDSKEGLNKHDEDLIRKSYAQLACQEMNGKEKEQMSHDGLLGLIDTVLEKIKYHEVDMRKLRDRVMEMASHSSDTASVSTRAAQSDIKVQHNTAPQLQATSAQSARPKNVEVNEVRDEDDVVRNSDENVEEALDAEKA